MSYLVTLLSLFIVMLTTSGFAPSCSTSRLKHTTFKQDRATINIHTRTRSCNPAASSAWVNQREAPSSRRQLRVLAAPATTTVDAEGLDYVPEIFPGRSLAPEEPLVRAFEEWMPRAGCKGDASLSHADFEGLRGLLTKNAVDPWKPFVTVPASLFLLEFATLVSAGASALPPPAPLTSEAWNRCPWWVRLGVRLLKENAAGEDSRLKEYIGILPEKGAMGTPLHWSAEQLDRLHYPRLVSQVAVQRRVFKGFQNFLLADAALGNSADSSGTDGHSSLLEALADTATFNWALECVLSRAFQLPPDNAVALVFEEGDDAPVRAPELEPPAPQTERMALLPVIDSVNHYSRVPTYMHWEADGAISVSVSTPLDPGDQVFLSYGPVSNDDLLQYFGFVERDNPSDTYVLQDMGNWLRRDGLLDVDLSTRLLACPGARETWRYLRQGVILRDAVHPATMQAIRVVCCEGRGTSKSPDGREDTETHRWDGTEADLPRFNAPVSLASEIAAFELLMRYSAREADMWGEAGVAAAFSEDLTAPALDGDLDGLGLDADRRLMLSVFRQEKLALLRGLVSRLTHMRKVSDLLNRPIKMPVVKSPPPVLGSYTPFLRTSSAGA